MNAKVFFAAAALALSAASQAAIVTSTLNNVTLQGNVYNVTFHQDDSGSTSFDSLFPVGGPSLPFTAANGFAATQELLAAVDTLSFDVSPGTSSATSGFRLVVDFDAVNYDYFTGWTNTAGNPNIGTFGPFNDFARNGGNSLSIATFELANNRVPVPGTLALAGLALVLLSSKRRRA